MKIKISSFSRIEGRAGFLGYLLNGQIKKAKIEVSQSARLIEGIIRERPLDDIPIIVSRICGICPTIHNLTSLKALEEALKIRPSPEVILMRKLMLCGQIIHSHAVHLFFLTLPDYLRNLTPKKKKFPSLSSEFMKVQNFGSSLMKVIGGRAIHPINSEIGGFKRVPNREELLHLLKDSNKALQAGISIANFFGSLPYPRFSRKTIFVSLTCPKEYAFYEGKIKVSEERESILPERFFAQIQEIESPAEVVKRVKFKENIYLTGALARINNNFSQLNSQAKKIFIDHLKEIPVFNTFYNNFAQAVEIVHFIEAAQKFLTKILKKKSRKLFSRPYKIKAGVGLGVAEAPRGTLFHFYQIDEKGLIKQANIITPTAQFLNNLEEDLKILLPCLRGLSKSEQRQKIELLVRAYDPCITCATH